MLIKGEWIWEDPLYNDIAGVLPHILFVKADKQEQITAIISDIIIEFKKHEKQQTMECKLTNKECNDCIEINISDDSQKGYEIALVCVYGCKDSAPVRNIMTDKTTPTNTWYLKDWNSIPEKCPKEIT